MKKISIICLAIFLYSGVLFSNFVLINNSFNIQLIFIAIPLMYSVYSFIKYKDRYVPIIYIFLFIFFSVPSMFLNKYSDFGKYIVIVGMVSVFSFISPQLMKKEEDFILFFKSLLAIGIIIVIKTILFGKISSNYRLSLNNSNPIWLSRSISVGMFYSFQLFTHKKIKLYTLLIISTSFSYVMLMTGSRGPLISVIIAMIILFIRNINGNKINYKAIFIISLLPFLMIALYYLLPMLLSKEMLNRFLFFHNTSQDDYIRIALYDTSFKLISKNIFGIGSGNFIKFSGYRYPHNILIEAFLEYGWAFGIYLLFLIIKCYKKLFRMAKNEFIYKVLLGFYVMSVLNSMISGDLTSPKELYITMSIVFYNYNKRVKENI